MKMEKFRLRKFIRRTVRSVLRPDTVRNNGVKLHVNFPVITEVTRTCLYEGGWEYPESKLIRGALQSTDRVLEVGAGLGMTGILCAKICGEDNVVSYEPTAELRDLILANHRVNNVSVELRSRAITADGRDLQFFQAENIASSSFYGGDDAMKGLKGCWVCVQSDAINDVIEELRPSFLVMDAEGAEAEILQAANLDNIRGMIVEIHRSKLGDAVTDALLYSIRRRGFSEAASKGGSIAFLRSS